MDERDGGRLGRGEEEKEEGGYGGYEGRGRRERWGRVSIFYF